MKSFTNIYDLWNWSRKFNLYFQKKRKEIFRICVRVIRVICEITNINTIVRTDTVSFTKSLSISFTEMVAQKTFLSSFYFHLQYNMF